MLICGKCSVILVLFRGSRVFFAIICVFVRIVRSGGLVFLSKGADGGDGTGDGESKGGGVEPRGGGKGAGEAWSSRGTPCVYGRTC